MTVCQRWRERRDSYRPAGEPFDPSQFGVEFIDRDGPARAFVEKHHYSGSYPAAVVRVGLYQTRAWISPELVGVAVFSVPCQPRVGACYAPGVSGVLELGRFVLLDGVKANAETWFLARARRLLRQAKPGIGAVVSYSDPFQRRTASGRLVMPGHVGTIYQAGNAAYLGRASSRYLILDREGRVLSERTLSKIRLEEVGWEGAARSFLSAGAPPRRPGEDLRAWVQRAIQEGPFQRVKHPGNHVYLWRLDGAKVASTAPYPKRDPEATGDTTRMIR